MNEVLRKKIGKTRKHIYLLSVRLFLLKVMNLGVRK
jgi:hypothetical protein